MNSIQVLLPDSIKDYVERQVASGAYGSASDFLCKLIVDAKTQEEVVRELNRQQLEADLLDGIHSGPPIAATPQFWAERDSKLTSRTDGN